MGEKNAADTIHNNLKRDITEKSCRNPKFYDKLSKLLDDIVKQLKEDAISYKEFLEKIEKLAQDVVSGGTKPTDYPSRLTTSRQRALYDNAPESLSESVREHFAVVMDSCITVHAQPGFETNAIKERSLKMEIRRSLEAICSSWTNEDLLNTVELVFNMAKSHAH